MVRRHGLGVNELPIASPVMVELDAYANIGDRARYPLVKAHGKLFFFSFYFYDIIYCTGQGILWPMFIVMYNLVE